MRKLAYTMMLTCSIITSDCFSASRFTRKCGFSTALIALIGAATSPKKQEDFYVPWSQCPWSAISAYQARVSIQRSQYKGSHFEVRFGPNLQTICLSSLYSDDTHNYIKVPQKSSAPKLIQLDVSNDMYLSHTQNKIDLQQRTDQAQTCWLTILKTPDLRVICEQRCTIARIRDKNGKCGYSVTGSGEKQYIEVFSDQEPKEVRIDDTNIASTKITSHETKPLSAKLEQDTCKSVILQ